MISMNQVTTYERYQRFVTVSLPFRYRYVINIENTTHFGDS